MKGSLFLIVLILILAVCSFAEEDSDKYGGRIVEFKIPTRSQLAMDVWNENEQRLEKIESRIKALEDALAREYKPTFRLQSWEKEEEALPPVSEI